MHASSDAQRRRARYVSEVAATVVALACGTNASAMLASPSFHLLTVGFQYVYSAWAPQFAHRLKLSSTEQNLIGTCGNLGMYAMGIPAGMMVDSKSPRWGLTMGLVLFAIGYYPIAREAYNSGPGYPILLLCLYSFFTGTASCAAFLAAIKTAALNFPESRGTATAFPLAAFGLSAMFFTTVAQAFPHSTYNFLILLASGTVLLPLLSFFFLNVVPTTPYGCLPQNERQGSHRRKSSAAALPIAQETGVITISPPLSPQAAKIEDREDQEDTALLTSTPGEDAESSKDYEADWIHPHHPDVRGFALLGLADFWKIFCLLGLMAGIGLMTINNIGNDSQALWKHYNGDVDPSFVERHQQLNVSIISFCSFTGRLLSGIGSDVLVSKFNCSRFWCLFIAASVFIVANLVAAALDNPNFLFLVSSLTGLAYGFLFGVCPSLVAHAFGVHGLSQNWGTMTLAPVATGNIFNLLYGTIYDSQSVRQDNGDLECLVGHACYSTAYWVTSGAAVASLGLSLLSIRQDNQFHRKKESKSIDGRPTSHDRIA
ncbi:hypothetical protein DV736_g3520, partial [Chaetothyriales sp. CBS 134916]